MTSVIRVESNVSGGVGGWGGGGAFSSTVEVWDGGWRVLRVVVCGCLLRSLLRPILSVTAGGSGECRGPV